MRQLDKKNIVVDFQSKKKKWTDLGVPENLIHNLEDLKMDVPAIIQAASIPKILEQPTQNFLFQAANGSGKTLSFSIPAIMRVDPSINAT